MPEDEAVDEAVDEAATSDPAPPFAGKLRLVRGGEWDGWYQWGGIDPFEALTGPFHARRGAEGIVCGFRPQAHHCNGHGMIHGGALMTFADFSLFMIGGSSGEEVHGVTVTMNSEFVGPARPGALLLARGELVRGGRSLLFVRGTITADEAPVLVFSGTIKRVPAPA
ncbi:MAG: hypothetical protein RIS94_2536 [Pseudomonadota bacterium]|jgi:acyl-coenzyme A thioesterase PaaI-like protein